jgi:hypothetical protein
LTTSTFYNKNLVAANSSLALKAALQINPVGVSINTANNVNITTYKSGIYTDCVNQKVDHAVTVVGFGTGPDINGDLKDYWIVRNSWGDAWGEQGYIRMHDCDPKVCGTSGCAQILRFPAYSTYLPSTLGLLL